MPIPTASTPLIIEPHPVDYTGLPFLTLIEYRKQRLLAIVDNISTDAVRAYILDLCGPEGVNEHLVIAAADEWYYARRSIYPLSIDLARRNLASACSKILRSLNTEFITRLIGPAFYYNMDEVKNVKKRRRKSATNTKPAADSTVVFIEAKF